MNRKLKFRAIAAAAVTSAFCVQEAHAVTNDLAVTVTSEFHTDYNYTDSNGNPVFGPAVTLGYQFTPAASGTEITAINVDLQSGRTTRAPFGPLPDLSSEVARIYKADTTTGTAVITQLASVNVTSSDPINTLTTGGGPLPAGASPAGPVLVYNEHTLAAPLILYNLPNVSYYVVTDIPIGYEWFLHTPGLNGSKANAIGGGQQLFTDPTINFVGEVSSRTSTTATPIYDPIGSYSTSQGGFNGDWNVNLNVQTPVISTPANLRWTNGSGNNAWDTASPNFTNPSSMAAAYSDSSNTLGGSGDNVTFNDSNGGAANYNVSIPSVIHPTSTTVSNSAGNYSFNGSGGIAGPGGLTKAGTSSLTLGTVNSYAGATNVNGGTLILAAAGALPSGTNLSIASGSKVFANNLGSATALTVGSLSVVGALDLNNNALIVHNSSIGAVTALAASGYNGGNWNGNTGLISTAASSDLSGLTALGVIQNSRTGTPSGAVLYGSFAGQSSTSTDVLAKYTYYGDANLDGMVDGSDYSRVDNAFLNNQNASNPVMSGWYNGDFNYDGTIDGSDYTLLDNAFNRQGTLIATEISAEIAAPTTEIAPATAVPEPASLSMLGIGAVGLLSRRRRW